MKTLDTRPTRVTPPRFQLRSLKARLKRRIFVNYRIPPDALAGHLPRGVEPYTIAGQALVGVCLIRLEEVRPAGTPRLLGLSSENAAHRVAIRNLVNPDGPPEVLILSQHTDSFLNTQTGGILFPGAMRPARFEIRLSPTTFKIGFEGLDGCRVQVIARRGGQLPSDSLFSNMEEASEFFGRGCDGWSFCGPEETMEGSRFACHHWDFHPLTVDLCKSSMINLLGKGKVRPTFDSAFLMEDMDHEWHNLGIRVEGTGPETMLS